MKKFIFLLLFCAGMLNAEVVTKSSTKTSSGTGMGATRDAAINNAIVEALEKMNGVKISSKKFVENTTANTSKGNDYAFIFNEQISKATNGRVDGYEIDEIYQGSDGNWEAAVTIKKTTTTKSYKTPGLDPNNRRRIAVINGTSQADYFTIDGEQKSSLTVADDITHTLVTALTKTRKFTVLDREATRAYNGEKALLLSGDAARDELLKLKNVLGTDYLFVFSVDEFSLSDGSGSTITTAKASGRKAKVRLHYNVIAMATRQVKFSDDLVTSFNVRGDNTYATAIQNIAKSITDEIINNIYPLKISSVNGDEILIAQNLKQGDVYEIFSLGKTITDAYTKEVVGKEESLSGQAQVVRVTPKMSYLKITSGSAKVGDLCRLAKGSKGGIDSGGREDNVVKIAPNGGIVLPF